MITHLASHHGTSGTGHWGFAIVGALWIVFGGVQAVRPDLSWRMRRWQYRNPEAVQPSARGLQVARIIGAVAVVAGIALVIGAVVTR